VGFVGSGKDPNILRSLIKNWRDNPAFFCYYILMALKFITGNKNKFAEVKLVIPEIEQLDIDLPEIQELDPKKIIEHKLLHAQQFHKGEYIVEDVSLNLECFDYKLPGPLIKWFLHSIGNQGIADMVAKLGKDGVEATEIIGYISEAGQITYFDGSVKGKVVQPKGDSSFGWSQIFLADGYDKTFGEMTAEERTNISMRGIAARKLKKFLINTHGQK
jgi:inosine triphosphate pyrophosphatase